MKRLSIKTLKRLLLASALISTAVAFIHLLMGCYILSAMNTLIAAGCLLALDCAPPEDKS